MKKWGALLLAAAITATAASLPAFARSLDDYYYEDYDYQGSDYRYEEYYQNGTTDGSGTIQMDGGGIRLKVGETKNLAANRTFHSADEDLEVRVVGDKQWASKDPSVASVDSGGVVTANKVGSTRITVSYRDNRGYRIVQTIRVTVGSGSESSVLSSPGLRHSFEVMEGKRLDLAVLLPDGADGIRWETGKEKIARVDDQGLVTAGAIGSCTVTSPIQIHRGPGRPWSLTSG